MDGDRLKSLRRLATECYLVGALAAVCWGCASSGFDKARLHRMQQVIDGSTNHLIGVSLADASKMLALDNVEWDKAYTSVPFGQNRIYHFQGFYLLLSLEALPNGISPDSVSEFSIPTGGVETKRDWWVANFYPRLIIDRLNNPAARMTNYWSELHEGFRKRNEEMKRRDETEESPI